MAIIEIMRTVRAIWFVGLTLGGMLIILSVSNSHLRNTPSQLFTALHSARPTPSSDILEWTKREIGAMFSFNMISMLTNESNTQHFCIGVQGDATSLAPVEEFNPSLIDLDDWLDVAVSFGAKYAVLTAQHCSGFSMWPTNVSMATGFDYKYSIKYSPLMDGKYDVVKAFIDSCKKHNVAPGIYYSLNQNFYLNVAQGKVMNSSLRPGQEKVSQDLYNKIALAQMTELWSNYGNLSELWFDGGCIPGLEDAIGKLSRKLQPHAVYFGGCSKVNNLRWVGTESGEPSYPLWSTTVLSSNSGCVSGTGEADGTVFCPAETDTTLQLSDKWFYRKDVGYRNLETLKTIYMKSVGQNSNLLLNVAANSSGLIPDAGRSIYKAFGEWITSCFGTAVARTTGTGKFFTLKLNNSVEITKVSVSEDQSEGEMVTRFRITAIKSDGKIKTLVRNGQSIGNKFIADLRKPLKVTKVDLTILTAYGMPTISDFSVYECKK